MSRESRRKEALYPRQFNFHRKKELPWQLFFCIPKTTRWASGSKEAYADEEK